MAASSCRRRKECLRDDLLLAMPDFRTHAAFFAADFATAFARFLGSHVILQAGDEIGESLILTDFVPF